MKQRNTVCRCVSASVCFLGPRSLFKPLRVECLFGMSPGQAPCGAKPACVRQNGSLPGPPPVVPDPECMVSPASSESRADAPKSPPPGPARQALRLPLYTAFQPPSLVHGGQTRSHWRPTRPVVSHSSRPISPPPPPPAHSFIIGHAE
jgi:hypothetical protein